MSQINIKKKSFDECIFVFKTSFNNENFIKDIFSSSKEGNLNIILRPISYRIFLNIFDVKSITTWIEVVSLQREEYKNKFKKYCKIKKFSGNPLEGGNIKNDEDKELKDLINKDLIRTYQDIDIFLQNNIKNNLANILYIWSKENESISYRQGMNEILAVLLLAFYPVYFVSKSKPKPNKNEIMNIVNQFMNEGKTDINYEDLYVFFHDEDEIQSDLYYTFDAIMKRGQQLLFDPKPLEKNDKNYNLYELFPNQEKIRIDDDVPTYINRRCAYLIYEKLQGIDEDLYDHFIKIDLPCTIVLQKWLRCLFNREYEYNDVLYLWDSIFAHEYIDKKTEKYSFIFVDYVALAMLIKIRDMLKDKDQNDCLSILFKYPKNFEISELLKLSEKVNVAMEERLNGKNSNIYDILGIMRPLQSRPNQIYDRPIKKKVEEPKNNNSNIKENNNNSNIKENNNNNISRYRKRSNENNNNSEESKGIMGTLSKIGGIVKDNIIKVTDKVSEKIDQLTSNDDYDNRNQYGNDMTQMNNNYYYSNEGYYENSIDIDPKTINSSTIANGNNMSSSMSTGYDKNDMMDIINKLEELDNRYSLYMSPKDKKDFKTIINYLKNNLN